MHAAFRFLLEKVELLSGPNRCSLEACAPLLAASGHSFVEALLCLYRGRGLHEDALALATEERYVSVAVVSVTDIVAADTEETGYANVVGAFNISGVPCCLVGISRAVLPCRVIEVTASLP